MKWYQGDLHIHSVLSPCAAIEMTPRRIVAAAEQAGVELLAVTDHNAGDNVAATIRAAVGTKLHILPGMEVETREEIHLLALFDTLAQLEAWQRELEPYRRHIPNDERKFGAQLVVDEFDELVAVQEELLITAVQMDIASCVTRIRALGGLVIASHVDRHAGSILEQLGFIPDNLPLDAVEVAHWDKRKTIQGKLNRPSGGKTLPLVSFSDAHTLDAIYDGPKTRFYLADVPSVAELRRALRGDGGRKFSVEQGYIDYG